MWRLAFAFSISCFVPLSAETKWTDPNDNMPMFSSIGKIIFSPEKALSILGGNNTNDSESLMSAVLKTPEGFRNLTSGFGIFNLGLEAQKVFFQLYTLKNKYKQEMLSPEEPRSFTLSSFDKTQRTIIVIHGYTEDATHGTSTAFGVVKAYQSMERPENIIFVDYHLYGRQLNYYDSVNNVRIVGKRLAEFLIHLRIRGFVRNLARIRIVGYSLGAHVGGVAGAFAAGVLEETISRITGLDPAGPGFRDLNNTLDRLDSTDASFVDVIHTNMGILFNNLGSSNKGTADFYPNGGAEQPGCKNTIAGEFGPVGACSHHKAARYFIKTVKKTEYMACPCSDWQTFQKGLCNCTDGPFMGEFLDPTFTGDYYLTIPKEEEKE